jgi:hypothetical protein
MASALVHGVRSFLSGAGTRHASSPLGAPASALVVAGCGGTYGAVMAAHGGLSGDRALMVLFGAIKVPLLFTATLALGVPFFWVLHVVLGVGRDFRQACRALVDHQLAVALQLGALAPVTALMNVTEGDYRLVQAWSTAMFALAAWNARLPLARAYAPLEAAGPVHRRLRLAWTVLYAFVCVQMAWDLRPFVGDPTQPVAFFRDHIGNAYVEVPQVLADAFTRLAP